MTEKGKRFEKRQIIDAPNKTAAKKRAKEFYKDILTKKIKHVPNAAKAISVAIACDDYLTYLKTKRRKDSTIAKVKSEHVARINKVCGEKPIALIEDPDIEKLANSLSHCGAHSMNQTLRYFRAIIKRAARKGLRTSVPEISDYIAKVHEKEIVTWNAQEKEKALNAAKSLSIRHEAMITLGLYCGLRIGEIAALQKSDINLIKSDEFPFGSLTVRRTYSMLSTDPEKIQTPKGNRTRTLPLTPITRSLLQRLILRTESKWLMHDFTPNKPQTSLPYHTTNSLTDHFRRVNKVAFGKPSYNTHIMRHTFCSDLYRATKNPYLVMAVAGHADLKQTQRYVHLVDREKALGVLALDPADANSRLELLERQAIELCGGDKSAAMDLLSQVSERLSKTG